MTRDQIIANINYQKVELAYTLDKAKSIQAEISELETQLYSLGESLNNPRVCFDPILFSQRKCEQCGFYGRCVFVGRGEYGRFKL